MNKKIRRYKIERDLRDKGYSSDTNEDSFEKSVIEEVNDKLKKRIKSSQSNIKYIIDKEIQRLISGY
jgi:uncharacterized FlaG/YvyC family protein